MTTATVNLSKELGLQVDDIVKELGFGNKEEFFQEAIKDKVLELQKKLFFQGSNQVAVQLKKKGITEQEILQDFERRVRGRRV